MANRVLYGKEVNTLVSLFCQQEISASVNAKEVTRTLYLMDTYVYQL